MAEEHVYRIVGDVSPESAGESIAARHLEAKAKELSIPQIIDRLVAMQNAAQGCIPDGWEVPDQLHPDYCDLVLDMLGVPQDNTLEFCDEYGHIEDWDMEAVYCRDFVREKYWLELLPGLINSEQFVRDILKSI